MLKAKAALWAVLAAAALAGAIARADDAVLLVDWGDSAGNNAFGTDWQTVALDTYTTYTDAGPDGTKGSTTAAYNYQRVSGERSMFYEGDQIVVTWFNNYTSPITITPYITFDDPDGRTTGASGTWYTMSTAEVPVGSTATTTYTFTSQTAGSHILVNVNSNYAEFGTRLVCDKVELVRDVKLLVDWGDSAENNLYGTDWQTAAIDGYSHYSSAGPDGIEGTDTGAYNFQRIGGALKAFAEGDTITVTWYNNFSSTISFTPQISFEDPDRRTDGQVGAWHQMSAVQVAPYETGITTYTFTAQTAGTCALVNVNSNFNDPADRLICDKVELSRSGKVPPAAPAAVHPNEKLLIDWGASSSLNVFGTAWTTAAIDGYSAYSAAGPDGIEGTNTGAYNFQKVSGAAREFKAGDRIVVRWYNNYIAPISITPYISFNDTDGRTYGASGTWYTMSAVEVQPGLTATTSYTFTTETAGSYTLVNVNSNFNDPADRLICDRFELEYATDALVDWGASEPENSYGTSWTTVAIDNYSSYSSAGPDGITGSTTAPYNFQRIGGAARTFNAGDVIVVTWFNNHVAPLTFTPYISFDDSGRRLMAPGGTWHPMTTVGVSPGGTAVSTYTVRASTAGSHSLVNVNSSYSDGAGRLICDKFEVVPGLVEIKPYTFNPRLEEIGETSVTSPVSIDGDRADGEQTVELSDGEPEFIANDRWIANVPLDEDSPKTITVTLKEGETTVSQESATISWEKTNVLETESITIRKGDSLLLSADPISGYEVTIEIDVGNDNTVEYTGTPEDAFPQAFNEAGTVEVRAKATGKVNEEDPEPVVLMESVLTVTVVDVNFEGHMIADWVRRWRNWKVAATPSAAIDAVSWESAVSTVDVKKKQEFYGGEWHDVAAPEGMKVLHVCADNNDPEDVKRFLARLGEGGPIIAVSPEVKGVTISSTAADYLAIEEVYENGDMLVSATLKMTPLLPDIDVELSIVAGNGSLFENGLTTMTIPSSELDAYGEYVYRMVLPEGETSCCQVRYAKQYAYYPGTTDETPNSRDYIENSYGEGPDNGSAEYHTVIPVDNVLIKDESNYEKGAEDDHFLWELHKTVVSVLKRNSGSGDVSYEVTAGGQSIEVAGVTASSTVEDVELEATLYDQSKATLKITVVQTKVIAVDGGLKSFIDLYNPNPKVTIELPSASEVEPGQVTIKGEVETYLHDNLTVNDILINGEPADSVVVYQQLNTEFPQSLIVSFIKDVTLTDETKTFVVSVVNKLGNVGKDSVTFTAVPDGQGGVDHFDVTHGITLPKVFLTIGTYQFKLEVTDARRVGEKKVYTTFKVKDDNTGDRTVTLKPYAGPIFRSDRLCLTPPNNEAPLETQMMCIFGDRPRSAYPVASYMSVDYSTPLGALYVFEGMPIDVFNGVLNEDDYVAEDYADRKYVALIGAPGSLGSQINVTTKSYDKVEDLINAVPDPIPDRTYPPVRYDERIFDRASGDATDRAYNLYVYRADDTQKPLVGMNFPYPLDAEEQDINNEDVDEEFVEVGGFARLDGPTGYNLEPVYAVKVQFIVPDETYNNGANPDAQPVVPAIIGQSDPRPTVEITDASVSLGSDAVVVRLSGIVRDPIADNMPRSAGTVEQGGADIAEGCFFVDDSKEPTTSVPLANENDTGSGFWKQYPYKGVFRDVAVQIPLSQGGHAVRVETSPNAAGNIGFDGVAVVLEARAVPGGSQTGGNAVIANIYFPVEPSSEVADAMRFYYGERDPVLPPEENPDPQLSENVGEEDSLVFRGEFGGTATVASVNPDTWHGLTDNADTFEGTVTYTFSDGANMVFSGLFTETGPTTRVFRAAFGVLASEVTQPVVVTENVYIPSELSATVRDQLQEFSGTRDPLPSDPVFAERTGEEDSLVFYGYDLLVEGRITLTDFEGLSTEVDTLSAVIEHVVGNSLPEAVFVETGPETNLFRAEITVDAGGELIPQRQWVISGLVAMEGSGEGYHLPVVIRVEGIPADESLVPYSVDLNESGLRLQLTRKGQSVYLKGPSTATGEVIEKVDPNDPNRKKLVFACSVDVGGQVQRVEVEIADKNDATILAALEKARIKVTKKEAPSARIKLTGDNTDFGRDDIRVILEPDDGAGVSETAIDLTGEGAQVQADAKWTLASAPQGANAIPDTEKGQTIRYRFNKIGTYEFRVQNLQRKVHVLKLRISAWSEQQADAFGQNIEDRTGIVLRKVQLRNGEWAHASNYILGPEEGSPFLRKCIITMATGQAPGTGVKDNRVYLWQLYGEKLSLASRHWQGLPDYQIWLSREPDVATEGEGSFQGVRHDLGSLLAFEFIGLKVRKNDAEFKSEAFVFGAGVPLLSGADVRVHVELGRTYSPVKAELYNTHKAEVDRKLNAIFDDPSYGR